MASGLSGGRAKALEGGDGGVRRGLLAQAGAVEHLLRIDDGDDIAGAHLPAGEGGDGGGIEDRRLFEARERRPGGSGSPRRRY